MILPKNRYYCQACQRPKMLFETENSADRFIKFNSVEMLETNGSAPVRSYYCQLCCGWHVTSNPSLESGKEFDKRDCELISIIARQLKKKRKDDGSRMVTNSIASKSSALIEKAKHRFEKGKMDMAKGYLQDALNEINDGLQSHPQWAKGTELKYRAESLLSILENYFTEHPLP